MTTTTVSPALRALIDERLDGIDRVLRHARTPRAERLEILDSVETQILEMLAARATDEPTRRDLLGVLAELDPPEAYALGDDGRERSPDVETVAARNVANPTSLAPQAKWSTMAILAGAGIPIWIFGAVATVLLALAMDGDGAATLLYMGFAVGVLAAFVNTGIGVAAMIKIDRSNGALKGMAFAAAGACLPLLFLFHLIAMQLCLAMASSDSIGPAFFLLWVPYAVSLPLPVAWALFERFRRRPCVGG